MNTADWENVVNKNIETVLEGQKPPPFSKIPSGSYRSSMHKELKKMKQAEDPFDVKLTKEDRKALKRDLAIQKLIDKEGYKKSIKRIKEVRRSEGYDEEKEEERKREEKRRMNMTGSSGPR